MSLKTLAGLIFLAGLSIGVDAQINTFPASGNVGIGTTGPDQKLTIKGGGIGFDNNSADKKLYSPADGTLEWMTHDLAGEHGFAISHQGEKRVYLNTNGNSYLIGGNLGVGISNPAAKLDVNGNIQISNAGIPMGLMTEVVGSTTPLLNMSINFREANKSYSYRGAAFRIDSRESVPLFQWLSRASGTNYENTLMTLSENGNVGIGVTGSSFKLDVNGSSRIVGTGDVLTIQKPNNNIPAIAWTGATYKSVIEGGDNFNFYTANISRMYITDGGNIGIGTTSPSEKLSVNGNIRSKKLIVTQQNWSDYVFEPSYQLQPLFQLEKYIKANRHLPEVPSARQVEKDGIDIGDNQAVLLKKIEELTLYMIEIKKENVQMKEGANLMKFENNELKKRIEKLENKK